MSSTTHGLPLADFPLFRTRDLDEAREEVARIFCPHRLQLVGRDAPFDAVHNCAQLDDVSLSFLRYGGPVRITPGELGTFFLVQIPLRGGAEISAGWSSVVSTPTRASVLSATDPIDMRWSADNPQLIVRLDRDAVERRLAALLGEPVEHPLRFALGMDLALPAPSSWLRLVTLAREELERGDGVIGHPVTIAHLEELLITGLLLAQPSNYSSRLDVPSQAAPPAWVRRAVEYMNARAHEPLTVTGIAEALGVSARSLQDGFRRHLHTTPMAYLRDVRLERAHQDLLDAAVTRDDTVTGIALRWGFAHQGRFAALHRERYGVSPSSMLRH